jgi:hypothetical protein
MRQLHPEVEIRSDHVAACEGLTFLNALGHLMVLDDGALIDRSPWRGERPTDPEGLRAAVIGWKREREAMASGGDGQVIDLLTRRRIA